MGAGVGAGVLAQLASSATDKVMRSVRKIRLSVRETNYYGQSGSIVRAEGTVNEAVIPTVTPCEANHP